MSASADNNARSRALILLTLRQLAGDMRRVLGDEYIEKKQIDPLRDVLADFRRAYSYITREGNPQSTDINGLYYDAMRLGQPDLRFDQATDELNNLRHAECFDTLDKERLPQAFKLLTGWDVPDQAKDKGVAVEIIAKKYLLLFIEIGKYLDAEPAVGAAYKKYTDLLRDNYDFRKCLRKGELGKNWLSDSYNPDTSYNALLATLGAEGRIASGQTITSPATAAPEDIAALKKQIITAKRAELDNLVGMDEAKSVLTYEFLARVLAGQVLKEQYNRPASLSLPHMVFTGNPGTGKTTLGMIAADLLWAYGALPERKFSRVTRSDLVGQYVGWTEKIVKEKLTAHLGGVIFFDEAHNLYAAKDNSKDFAHEVVAEIVNFLEENKNQCVAILSGYKDGIEQLMNMDDGLSSRFPVWVHMNDYNRGELTQIFNLKAQDSGLQLETPDLIETIMDYAITKQDKQAEKFGNAREMRNLVENLQGALYARLFRDGKIPTQQEITEGRAPPALADLTTVTAQDVQTVLQRDLRRWNAAAP